MDLYKDERWATINFEVDVPHPKYEISTYGRVKSYAMNKEHGNIIKGSRIQGYNSINIRLSGGKLINRYVHKLVAASFIEQPSPQHRYVIHLDYDKNNNMVHNLAWATPEELKYHNNNNPAVLKRRTTGYKLTENKVRIIKKLLASDKTRLSIIAKRFNITHTQLNRIRSGENWGHVTID